MTANGNAAATPEISVFGWRAGVSATQQLTLF